MKGILTWERESVMGVGQQQQAHIFQSFQQLGCGTRSTLEGTGMALLGELNKIVTVSETRFRYISKFGSDCVISLVGAPGEKVEVSVYDTGEKTAKVVTCNMSSSGTAILHVPQLWCSY